MTAARPGDSFHLDLEGTVINGRYLEVDPPLRFVIEWDLEENDVARPAPARIEVTLTPADDSTIVKVELSGMKAEGTELHRDLWMRHLDRIAAAFT